MQALAGAGDADIHQAAFFFHFVFINAGLMRQQPFFQPDQKDVGKFQPFGGVQGGKLHAVEIFVVFVEHGDERDGLDEFKQVATLFLPFAPQPLHEFEHVVPARAGVAFVIAGKQPGFVVNGLQEFGKQGVGRFAFCAAGDVLLQAGAVLHGFERAGTEHFGQGVVQAGGKEAEFVLGSKAAERFNRARTNAAPWRGEAADEGQVVIRIGQHAQPGGEVADFGFFKKRLPTREHVRNALGAQVLLKQTRLMVAAVQNGVVGVAGAATKAVRADAVDDAARFVFGAGGGGGLNGVACAEV